MVIRTDLLDPSNEPDLHWLVKTYQIHRYPKLAVNIEMQNEDFILVIFD